MAASSRHGSAGRREPTRGRARRRNNDTNLAHLSEADRAVEIAKRKGELSLAEAGLTVRTVNTLENKHISTINDVLDMEAENLLAISNFGDKTLKEIYDVVVAQGLTPPRSWLPRLPKVKKPKA